MHEEREHLFLACITTAVTTIIAVCGIIIQLYFRIRLYFVIVFEVYCVVANTKLRLGPRGDFQDDLLNLYIISLSLAKR